jgi:antitoxin ParD1/3/4
MTWNLLSVVGQPDTMVAPDPMKDFSDRQVASGRYSSASEYVRELIREDEKRRAEEKLEVLLLEGLNSGDPIEITPEYWEGKRQQLIKRHQERTSAG